MDLKTLPAMQTHPRKYRSLAVAAAVLAIAFAGCKSTPKVTDASLTSTIQSTLAADSAIAGQPVNVAVQGGIATLSGSVSNDAQRALAARDAAGVAGVAQVVNDITVGPATANNLPLAPPPPAPTAATSPAERKPTPRVSQQQPAPIERPQEAFNPPPPQPLPQPQPQPQPQPSAPPPPPQPTFRTVTIPSSSTIPVRITQTLDSATTQAGTPFSGVVASDIVIDGLVAIPAGSNVSGRVDAVQEAAHFKGSSLLTISISTINRHGERMDVTADPYTVTGKGRGVNTAEKTGGGAAVGAILGGIFGGGKGAAIGAAAGGGVGAGSQAVTRGQQVQIASESVVRFHLSSPIAVRVRTDGGDHPQADQGLHDRSNQ
jgi:hypothetical protein